MGKCYTYNTLYRYFKVSFEEMQSMEILALSCAGEWSPWRFLPSHVLWNGIHGDSCPLMGCGMESMEILALSCAGEWSPWRFLPSHVPWNGIHGDSCPPMCCGMKSIEILALRCAVEWNPLIFMPLICYGDESMYIQAPDVLWNGIHGYSRP